MQRYSRNREAILDCLRNSKEHPSAEWIYSELKKTIPELSLSTVYRNLNQLKEAGTIRSMGIVLGHERFDANTLPHTHATCVNCGKIVDIDCISVDGDIVAGVESVTGYKISSSELQLSGLCENCKKIGKKQRRG